jgi:hypothetical protein
MKQAEGYRWREHNMWISKKRFLEGAERINAAVADHDRIVREKDQELFRLKGLLKELLEWHGILTPVGDVLSALWTDDEKQTPRDREILGMLLKLRKETLAWNKLKSGESENLE